MKPETIRQRRRTAFFYSKSDMLQQALMKISEGVSDPASFAKNAIKEHLKEMDRVESA